MIIAINTKKIEPFETFLELLLAVIFDAELKINISDMLVSLDEAILLELQCMVDSMSEDDLFYKIEIYALIFSE